MSTFVIGSRTGVCPGLSFSPIALGQPRQLSSGINGTWEWAPDPQRRGCGVIVMVIPNIVWAIFWPAIDEG